MDGDRLNLLVLNRLSGFVSDQINGSVSTVSDTIVAFHRSSSAKAGSDHAGRSVFFYSFPSSKGATEEMIMLTLKPYIVLAAGLLIANTLSFAQGMAPGPALPGNTGGVGPGGTSMAPGPAIGNGPIEQEGPGGVPMAAGPPVPTQPHLHRHHRAAHRFFNHRFQ